ncbi:hypothetical protein WN943_002986 [Citrus x changshan-huyou]
MDPYTYQQSLKSGMKGEMLRRNLSGVFGLGLDYAFDVSNFEVSRSLCYVSSSFSLHGQFFFFFFFIIHILPVWLLCSDYPITCFNC